jgi:hypothetical protein
MVRTRRMDAQHPRAHRVRGYSLFSTILLTTLAACTDAVTGPQRQHGGDYGVPAADPVSASVQFSHFGPGVAFIGTPTNPDGMRVLAEFPRDRDVLVEATYTGPIDVAPIDNRDLVPSSIPIFGVVAGTRRYYGIDPLPDFKGTVPAYARNTLASNPAADSAQGTFVRAATLDFLISAQVRRDRLAASTNSSTQEVVVYVTRGTFVVRQQGAPHHCGPTGIEACTRMNASVSVQFRIPRARLTIVPRQVSGLGGQIRVGDQFNFLAGVAPNVYQGQGMPRSVRMWEWIDNATGRATPVTRCAGQVECLGFTIPGAGRMRVSGWANNDSTSTEMPIPLGAYAIALQTADGRSWYRAGDAVTFLPRVTPTEGRVDVAEWRWVPDGGPQQVVCGTAGTCTITPAVSGEMLLYSYVNGTWMPVARRRIIVVPCPTGDYFWDNPEIRRAMREAFDSSGANDPNIANRRERSLVVLDSAGVTRTFLAPVAADATPCSTSPATFPTPLGWRQLARGHIHPFVPNDTLPDACKNERQLRLGQTIKYGSTFGGPSDSDWIRAHADTVIELILDRKRLYRANWMPFENFIPTDSGYRPRRWRHFLNRYNRSGPGCTRP